MALFKDTTPKEPTLYSKIMKWVFRFLILAVVLIVFFIGSLNLLQGTGSSQINGLQQAISALSGKDASIQTLKEFRLFPELHLDMNGLRLSIEDQTILSLGHLEIKAPGAVIFSKEIKFRELQIDNLIYAEKDNAPIFIEQGRIKWPMYEGDPYTLNLASGKEQNWTLMLHLDSHMSKRGRIYKLSEPLSFNLSHKNDTVQGKLIYSKSNDNQNSILLRLSNDNNGLCVIGTPHLKNGQLIVKTDETSQVAFDPVKGFIDDRSKDNTEFYNSKVSDDERCPQ